MQVSGASTIIDISVPIIITLFLVTDFTSGTKHDPQHKNINKIEVCGPLRPSVLLFQRDEEPFGPFSGPWPPLQYLKLLNQTY